MMKRYHHRYHLYMAGFGGAYLIVAFILLLCAAGYGQVFTRISDPNNPIVNETDIAPGGYIGASWIDYDSDNDLDLFVNDTLLYRNEGNEVFVKVTGSGIGSAQPTGSFGHGNTWADFDNDGDLDCYLSGPNSFLYRNEGNGRFTQVSSGPIADGFGNRGWAGAWADINNDGWLDLVVTHPAFFIPGGPTPNHLFFSDGTGGFTKVDSGASDVTSGLAPYTVGTWADFDLDGDQDLFIGSGPANGSRAPDFLYKNQLVETGNADLTRITQGAIATEQQDGQVWNWIDYDNDGDLDAYLTNYRGAPNRLYRNDNGVYLRLTAQQAGPLADERTTALSNVWADFDNDGDLDAFTTNDAGAPGHYYRNNGDGTFTEIDTIAVVSQARFQVGATAGDYDRDGDLDLYVTGPSSSAKALYRNESQNTGNHWVNLHLVGTASNRSAIGATVRAKALINGGNVWQIRQVSAQNSFNSQNSLNVHFGLADAAIIDSLEIRWPSGAVEVFEAVAANRFYTATENQGLGLTGIGDDRQPEAIRRFVLYPNFPNPFNPSTQIRFRIGSAGLVSLTVYDAAGKRVQRLLHQSLNAGEHRVRWDGRNDAGQLVSSGLYLYRLEVAGQFSQTRKMILLR